MSDSDSDIEDESKTDRRKRLANARQKKYYQRNKDTITAGFQKSRDDLKKCEKKQKIRKEQRLLRAQNQEPVQEPIPVPEPVVEPIPVVRIGRKRKTVYTIEYIREQMKDLKPETTKKTYFTTLDIIFRASRGTDMAKFLQNFTLFKKRLENVKMLRGGDVYNITSRINQVKMVIFCCDPVNNISVPLDHETLTKYKNWIKVLDLEIQDIQKARRENPENAVLPFPVYMSKVLEKYGENSMEYLIVSLYNENTLRDNYGSLVVIASEREIDKEKSLNYLINPRGVSSQCKIVIQNYKTAGNNGIFRATLSRPLTKLLRNYIRDNGLESLLFPGYQSGLSSMVSKMNRDLGIKSGGGINYLRHSKVATLFNGREPTHEERAALSTSMTHSVGMQVGYNRLLK